MAYSVFNPADKSAGLTLTDGNLTATAADPARTSVRGDILMTAGKAYVEWTNLVLFPETLILSPNIYVGIANATWPLSTYGGNVNSAAWDGLFGQVHVNNVGLGTIGSFTTGETLAMAVNLDADLVWFRKNCGFWNNDILARQDPATNTGGYDISAITADGIYLMAGFIDHIGNAVTLNAGATEYFCTPPDGYPGLADAPPPPPPPPPPRLFSVRMALGNYAGSQG